MPRRPRYEPLNTFLNSRIVGQLRREPSGAISFQYDHSWIEWTQAIPVSLSLPIREQEYTGAPVVAVFENLLPDNLSLRRRIAARVHAEGTDAYSLLGAIGHDCVGALQFLQLESEPGPAGAVDGAPIDGREIIEILNNLASAPLGITEDESFRISIAGAQEKTALLFRNGQWYRPGGTTATTHILKPSIGRLPNGIDLTHSVENEYLCLKILRALGVPAANAAMTTFGDRRVLVVERFDRLWTSDNRLLRLPQEDCCQALSVPPSLKYESDGGPGVETISRLLEGSDDARADQRLFLKANILFWLLGATDGHGKNFSVFLSSGGRFQLTPLYDVISAQPSVDSKQILWKQFRLAMAVGSKRHYKVIQIAPRHFVETAEKSGVGKQVVSTITEELRDSASAVVDSVISGLAKGFPEDVAGSIQKGVKRRLKLLKESEVQKS
jgi:serine/threonine-protein kinase HipA